MCKKCMGKEISNQRYCELCALNEEMKNMDTDTPLGTGEGKAIAFKSSFSVKADKATGKIIGWDDFFQYIDNTSGEMAKEIEKYKDAKDDIKATYVIESVEGNSYNLKNN